jgi:hypothetical protein
MRAVALFLLAVTACAYDTPWTAQPYGPDTPFDPASPGRVTINTGIDRTPAWVPGDTALLYSAERTSDHDRCLGVLSARTWTLERTLCHGSLVTDSNHVDAFEWPAVRGGRVAFQWAHWLRSAVKPAERDLMVASLDRWDHGRILLTFQPYGFGLTTIDGVQRVQWVSDTSLVYEREQMVVTIPPPPSPPIYDTTITAVDIERVDFGSDSAVVAIIPGSDGATSLAVNDSATAIYYTLPGDSLVYRLALDSAVASVAHAFPGGVFPRDVQVRGTRLVAIVGGDLHLVDLRSLSDSTVTGPGVAFHNPVLSRDGHLIVVEGNAGSGVPDLWRVAWP